MKRVDWEALRKEKQQTVVAMARLKFTDEQIAERMGLSTSRVSHIRQAGGLKRRPARKLSDEQISRIQELAGEGWPPSEIAAELGISYWGVAKYMQDFPNNGRDWRNVAIWASRKHTKLWEELRG